MAVVFSLRAQTERNDDPGCRAERPDAADDVSLLDISTNLRRHLELNMYARVSLS